MIADILIPLSIIIGISLVVFMLTNRSFVVLTGTLAMVITVTVWSGGLPQLFYIVSALFIGISLWISFHGVNL